MCPRAGEPTLAGWHGVTCSLHVSLQSKQTQGSATSSPVNKANRHTFPSREQEVSRAKQSFQSVHGTVTELGSEALHLGSAGWKACVCEGVRNMNLMGIAGDEGQSSHFRARDVTQGPGVKPTGAHVRGLRAPCLIFSQILLTRRSR